jgi:hypothetical protein
MIGRSKMQAGNDRRYRLESVVHFAFDPPANELRANGQNPLKWFEMRIQ